MPNDGKVGAGAKVLRDGDRLVEVEDDVPVAAGDEHSLAGVLNQFDLEEKSR